MPERGFQLFLTRGFLSYQFFLIFRRFHIVIEISPDYPIKLVRLEGYKYSVFASISRYSSVVERIIGNDEVVCPIHTSGTTLCLRLRVAKAT